MPAAPLSLQLNTGFVSGNALWVIAASLGEVKVNKIRACIVHWEFVWVHSSVLTHLCQSVMSAQLHRWICDYERTKQDSVCKEKTRVHEELSKNKH